jgi:hypothetical protein
MFTVGQRCSTTNTFVVSQLGANNPEESTRQSIDITAIEDRDYGIARGRAAVFRNLAENSRASGKNAHNPKVGGS